MDRMTEAELLAQAEAMRMAAATTPESLAAGQRAIAQALEELVLIRKLLTWVGYDGWQVPDQVYDLVAHLSDGDSAWYPPFIGPRPRPKTREEMSQAERQVDQFDRILARAMAHGQTLDDRPSGAVWVSHARPFAWDGLRTSKATPYDDPSEPGGEPL